MLFLTRFPLMGHSFFLSGGIKNHRAFMAGWNGFFRMQAEDVLGACRGETMVVRDPGLVYRFRIGNLCQLKLMCFE